MSYLVQSSSFQSDPTASLLENFDRLAKQEGWTKKSKTYKNQKRAFLGEAVVEVFWDTFGGNVSSLQAWQSLCKTIGVPESREGKDPLQLTSIRACKQVCCPPVTLSVSLMLYMLGPQGHLC